MKKIGLLALVLALLAATACSSKGKKNNEPEQIAESIDSKNETTNNMKTIELTKADFLTKVANYEANPNEWKYLGDKPAIVDFYASWCGPCKAIAPILDELAAEYADQIYIYKVDTDKEQELAAAFGIRSIPSILFIPMDEQPQMAQGALPKSDFKEAIDKLLLKK